MIKLGDKVRDNITGFEGTVTGRAEYLNGCVRYQVEAGSKDGIPHEYWLDEDRLISLKYGRKKKSRPGGPRQAPPKRSLEL
jgi:hypothetical protein